MEYRLFPDPLTSSACAPSVLITFINMVLFKSPNDIPNCNPYMYAGESGLEKFLVLIALLCVPWMLFAKPLMLMQERKKKHMQVRYTFAITFSPDFYLLCTLYEGTMRIFTKSVGR